MFVGGLDLASSGAGLKLAGGVQFVPRSVGLMMGII